MTTETTKPRPAAKPVRVRNLVCIKCDSPLYHSPARWLHCRNPHCRPIPFALGTRAGVRS